MIIKKGISLLVAVTACFAGCVAERNNPFDPIVAGRTTPQVGTYSFSIVSPDGQVDNNTGYYDFGNMGVGYSTDPTPFTISNDGETILPIKSIAQGEGDASHFNIDSSKTKMTLNPGEKTEFNVIFTPASEIEKKSEIVILTESSEEPAFRFHVSGRTLSFDFQIKNESPLNIDFGGNSRCAFAGGSIFLTSGWLVNVETDHHHQYDALNDIWITKSPLPARRQAGMTAVVNDEIYYMGGHYAGRNSQVWKYNIGTDAWTPRASLLEGNAEAEAIYNDGYIYMFGGRINPYPYPHTNKAYRYNTTANTWGEIGSLPVSDIESEQLFVVNSSLIIRDGKIILIGLYIFTEGKYNHAILEYDPSTDQYIQDKYPLLPDSLRNAGAFDFNGELYIIGGYDSRLSQSTNLILRLSKRRNTWETVGQLPFAGWSHNPSHCILAGSTFYLIGIGSPLEKRVLTAGITEN